MIRKKNVLTYALNSIGSISNEISSVLK